MSAKSSFADKIKEHIHWNLALILYSGQELALKLRSNLSKTRIIQDRNLALIPQSPAGESLQRMPDPCVRACIENPAT